jgi:hypothetical protein
VAALAGIQEVLVAHHLATRLVDEPLDEWARFFAEEVRQRGIALVVVLLEDVFCHQVEGIVEDAGLALEAGTGGGDQARRACCVAPDLGSFSRSNVRVPRFAAASAAIMPHVPAPTTMREASPVLRALAITLYGAVSGGRR